MQKRALWAKTHPWKTRILLLCTYLILGTTAFAAGILLAQWGFGYRQIICIMSGMLFIATWLAYPESGCKRRRLARRKNGKAMLVISSFAFCAWAGISAPEGYGEEIATDPPVSLLSAVLENDGAIPIFITNTIPLCEACMTVDLSHKQLLKTWEAVKGKIKGYYREMQIVSLN